ncbi:MAG: S9 family peptidase [Opitutaceae bacterium]|nr:S9 family peptidase [Opitutaceae bacterium]
MLSLRLSLALLLGLATGLTGFAAPAAPRALTHADFDTWRSIATPQLSRDGRWLAYSFMPQDADGDLVVREVATGREHRVPVGAIPPPTSAPADENANPEAPPPVRNIRLAFTGDSRFVVATTHPPKADVAAAKRAKKKPEEMPRGGLVMIELASGEVTRVAEVKSFQVAAKGGPLVAYLKEAKPEDRRPADATEAPPPNDEEPFPADDEDAAAPARGGRGGAGAGGTATGAPTFGTELVIRDLAAKSERTFAAVTDYSLTRDGRVLLYLVSSRSPTDNGVYRVLPATAAEPVALLSGRGRYSRLTWDREQNRAVFLSDTGAPAGTTGPARYKVYLWERGTGLALDIVSAETKGVPAGFTVSAQSGASFSRDGKKLYVPVARAARTARPATGAAIAPDDEKVTADLWHWRDGYVQPMQKVRAAQERNRTYRGVFDLSSMTYVQLATPELATITTSDDGTRVLGYDDRAYRSMVDYDGRFTDVHLVDPQTGASKTVLKQLRSEGGAALLWSPDGKWAAYYQGRQWHALDTATGQTRSLTATLRVAFHNEQDDRPQPPTTYGAAGWTKDSVSFLAYDRFDVWQLFPDGRAAKNLTVGHGRANKIQLRVQRIEPVDEDEDERGIDPAKPLTLRGEHEETRATGFYRTLFESPFPPDRLLWGDKNFRYVGRARDADALLLTASRFDEFPDVHVTNSSFATPKKMTDGGAQLAQFSWGRSELISFRNADGVPLQATLYTPANFDPKRKYPVIIYIYERLSQNVHSFSNPAPGTSINVPFYVSNGYCVLMPDIVYRTGRPGQSALRCVLPALDAIVARGFVDEKAVGIQGHSWGGYQIAYMVTQTNRFRAAEAGAPVGNMTSAYSGIRWGTGLPRQFQYEQTQSRIGKKLTDAPRTYLDNSPVFQVQKVETPLLILHNDADDAVPWYQGIELFLALRRHGKPAWLFNYNGEFHGLRRRPDQKDWAKRMSQFFDHFLKGAPAPEWLEKGIPYIERDEEKVKFNAPPAAAKPAAAQ